MSDSRHTEAQPEPPKGGSREAELRSLNRRRRTPTYSSLVLHWMSRWFRRAKRPEIAPLPTVDAGQVSISFAGHATVLIRYAGLRIVCDPMLGAWCKGVKRAVRPGLSPADLHDVDLILLSHAHIDHLHRPTLAKLPRAATVVVPPRTAQHISDLGFARLVELGVGQSVQDHGVDIATAAVRHGEGEGLSFIIRGDGPSVYFCGDSGYFSGFADVGKRYRPDIAILPIGGYAPASFRDRHMTPLDALYAFEDLRSRIMIPIHYGAFALSYELLSDPARWLAELVRQRDLEPYIVDLAPGQSRVFVPHRHNTSSAGNDGEDDDGIPEPEVGEPISGPSRHAPPEPEAEADLDDAETTCDEPPVLGNVAVI